MKKLMVMVFIIISAAALGKHDDHNLPFKEGKNMEALSPEQRDKLLLLRREYFSELKKIQEKFKELRKEANYCMMNNDENRYEKIHDKMNELKIEREKIKASYRKKIDEIMN